MEPFAALACQAPRTREPVYLHLRTGEALGKVARMPAHEIRIVGMAQDNAG